MRPQSTTQGSKNGYVSKRDPGGARNGYLSAGWHRKPPNAGPGIEGKATLMRGQGVSLWLGMELMQVGTCIHRKLADVCTYVYIDLLSKLLLCMFVLVCTCI